MPEIAMFGKLFFTKIQQKLSLLPKRNSDTRSRLLSMALIVGKIVGCRRRRRNSLPALHVETALASWRNLVLIRVGRDDHSAAGRQTENQFSIRRDANHPCARRSPSASLQLRVSLVKNRLPSARPI
jgi:hypothetical protein